LDLDPIRGDHARVKRAQPGKALELSRSVGAALEHLERGPGRERRERAKLHAADLAIDGGVCGVLAHVLDHRRAAGAQHAVALGATDARIPARDGTLHLGALEPPASCFRRRLHSDRLLWSLTLLGVSSGTIHLTLLELQPPLCRLEENRRN